MNHPLTGFQQRALKRVDRSRWVTAQNPLAITSDEYQRLCAFNWKNAHSRRIQQILNDTDIHVAFDGSYMHKDQRVGVWLIAQICKRPVIEHIGRREVWHEHLVPIVIGDCALRDGTPIPVTDPRVIDAIRFARFAKQTGWRQQARERAEREKEAAKAAKRQENRDRAKELYPAFLRWSESISGFVGREGAGGERKWFFKDSLHH